MAAQTVQKTRKRKNPREKKRLIFYICMFALPILQFLIFYCVANFNSLIISFQKFTLVEKVGYVTESAGFENFKVAFEFLIDPKCWEMTKYSLIYYLFNLLVITPLALIFSFYIAKKFRLSGFFRVMLYLPSIISAVVLAILFKYVCTDVIPYIHVNWLHQPAESLAPIFGDKATADSQFPAILFFNLWMAFGINTMLYVGSMTDINPSIVEAAKIDGAGPIRQFIHIYIPMIWPTLVTFIVTGLAGIFIEQMNLYTFFADFNMNKFSTFGYFFYVNAHMNSLYTVADPSQYIFNYSQLAAMGILITIIVIPVVLVVRKVLIKYGPSTK